MAAGFLVALASMLKLSGGLIEIQTQVDTSQSIRKIILYLRYRPILSQPLQFPKHQTGLLVLRSVTD